MDERKIALDEAAREVFLEKGYKQTNISEIAKRAGIAVGSFYKYYLSKEALFVQVYAHENERVRRKIAALTNWNVSPMELMESLFKNLHGEIANNNILSEWNNPRVSRILQSYYQSREGIAGNHFHQQMLQYIESHLANNGFDKQRCKEILRIYELIYYIDCSLTEETFADKSDTLEAMIRYIILGIQAEWNGNK